MQNVEFGVVWVTVSQVSPFDRVTRTYYLNFIETMHLSCTVFKL